MVTVKLRVGLKLVKTTAMIDTGTMSSAFIDTSFAQHHAFQFRPVTKPNTLHEFFSIQDGHLGSNVLATKLQVGTIYKEFNARLFIT